MFLLRLETCFKQLVYRTRATLPVCDAQLTPKMEILGFSPSRGPREASFFPPNKLPRIVWKDRAARARVNAPMIALTRTFPLQQVNPGSLPLSGVLIEYFAVSSFHPDRFTFVFAHTFF